MRHRRYPRAVGLCFLATVGIFFALSSVEGLKLFLGVGAAFAGLAAVFLGRHRQVSC